jgi:N-acetylneuraminic acid mutarotase
MWVFGGTSSVPVDCAPSEVAFLNTLWLYDDPCGRWRKVKSRGPSRRARHMATFGDERMWTFGGRYRAGTGGYYALYYDLWTFDPEEEAWQRMPSGNLRPTARTSGALVYDPSRARLWLMGGNQSEHGSIYLPTNDVWSYSVVEESWQQHNVSVGPSPRFFHAAAIDGVRDRLLVFGGASADAVEDGLGYFSDLWALDLQTLTWQELTPSGSVPDGRFWTQLVHDEKADEYVLFGGHDDGALGHRNDTWRFDPESGEWTSPDSEDTLRTPVTGTCEFPADFVEVDRELPERRHAHTLVWSSACEHALLFGGKTDCGATDDVWRWSSAGWNERSPARHGEVCQRWASDPGDCESLCY